MLQVSQLYGFNAGGKRPPVSKVFLGAWGFNATSFGPVSLGVEDPSRIVVVAGGCNILGSLSIDGNALTTQAISGNTLVSARAWPTGTSGTFSFSGTAFTNFGSYVVYGAEDATADDTATGTNSVSIDAFLEGLIIASAHTNNGATGITWTGVTTDALFSGNADGCASYETIGPLETNRSVSYSASGGIQQLAAASWKPPPG